MWSHLRSLWPFYTLYKCHKIIIIFFVLRLKIFIIYRTTYRNNQKTQKCATVIRRCSKLSHKTNLVENFIKCIFSSVNSKFVNKQRANDQFEVNQRNYKYVFHILIYTIFSYNFSSTDRYNSLVVFVYTKFIIVYFGNRYFSRYLTHYYPSCTSLEILRNLNKKV